MESVECTDDDSGNESSEYDYYNDYVGFNPQDQKDKHKLEDNPFEVMTIEQILKHMNECIEEVRIVTEVYTTHLHN